MLRALVDLNGDRSVLDTAADKLAAASDAVRAALDNLRAIADRLSGNGANVELFFDLAELRGYYYHTGVMFAAYLPGHGQAIAWGGRYDDIGKVFGRARPATGFSADLKTLVRLGKIASRPRNAIFAPADADAALEVRINELRAQGECVVRGLPGQSGDAAAMGCTRELVKTGDDWVVKDQT
jgi:ATP phosphoribosyltransferase regulatory subunit